MKPVLRALCVFGLLVAALCIAAAVWFHRNFDAIIRIPFVLGSFTVGALLGVYCIGWLLKSLRDGDDRS
jgi:hypothetical protein